MATSIQGPSSSAKTSCLFCRDMGRNGAELVTCFACGDRYCPGCSRCACDRLVAFLDDLLQLQNKESRLPLLQSFIQKWAE
jgi:hypothetical protein